MSIRFRFSTLVLLGGTLSLAVLLKTLAISERASPASASAEANVMLQRGEPELALRLLLELHKSQPENYQVCYQTGIAYTQLQQFEKGAEFYRKALKIHPHFLPARKNLGTVLWFLDRKQESVQEFVTVLKAQPADPVPHLFLGSFEYEQNRFERAKTHFEKAGDLAFKNPDVVPMVIESYLATKDLSAPTRLLGQLQQAAKPDTELVFEVGALFGKYGFYEQSIEAFQKIKSSYPDRYALLLNLGKAQLNGGQFRASIESLEAIVSLNLAKQEVYLLMAEAFDKLQLAERAYSAYSQAIESNPLSEQGYIELSNFAAAHQNTEFARKIIKQGLRAIPRSSVLFMQQGIIWALDGNLKEAQDNLATAIQIEPQWGLPALALGMCRLQGGQLTEAAASFQEAARKSPDDYRAEYFYAQALIQTGAETDPTGQQQIISALRKAITLNPRDPESRISLGQTLLAADQVAKALLELEKAVELDPRNPMALYHLAVACRRHGDSQRAARLLQAFEKARSELKEKGDQEKQALIQILRTRNN